MSYSVFPPASSGLRLYTQTFTSSGTFTLPSGYGAGNPLICEVLLGGGGGGGGAGGSGTAGTNAGGGGGGGSGIVIYLPKLEITSNTSITIGAGGTGGTSVSAGNNTGGAGGQGGTTSFGEFTAVGGRGGGGGSNSSQNSNQNVSGINTLGIIIPGTTSQNDYRANGGPGGSGGGSHLLGSGIGASFGRGWSDLRQSSQSGSGITSFMVGYSTSEMRRVEATINPYQRGGGGAGGNATTDGRVGLGGNPGGMIGGDAGLSTQVPSSNSLLNGIAATIPSGGGGGGGALRTDSGGNPGYVTGTGGAGASGFVTITYWA